MNDRPERRHTVGIKIGADTWDDVFAALGEIKRVLIEGGPGASCVSGGTSFSYIVAEKKLPGMTNERYFVELTEWLEEQRKKESE